MALQSFRELDVWKVAHRLTLDVYKAVRGFPDDERFCLALQMRRASISIGANIAEGCVRFGPKDQRRIFNIARGSAEELRYFLILARDLGYLKGPSALEDAVDRVCAMLHKLIRSAEGRMRS
jgi:four helix bundle protein